MFVTPAVATRLLDGWMKHFSTRYPVIHSHRLREIHSRRNDTLDFFEESILHLVYANSGRFLETVSEIHNLNRRPYILTIQRQERREISARMNIMKLHYSIWTPSCNFMTLAL